MEDARAATPPPRNSHEALARSIVRAVQRDLPAPDEAAAIHASVDAALRAEGRANERLLAQVRAAFLLTAAVLGFVAHVSPTLVGLERYPLRAVGMTLAWALVASALVLALGREWHPRWLRWAVPMLDALIIVSTFVVLYLELGRHQERMPLGTFGVQAVACALLALSGALRLSRTSARMATGLAFLSWLSIAAIGRLPWLPSAVVAALLLACGLLAGRVNRVVRRVVTEEVARLRLGHLYHEAQQAVDAREEVLKIVAHDLRNPLSTIAMAADLLLEVPATDEQRARQLAIIKRSGERMNRLIHDLLDAARIQAGRLPIEPRAAELPTLFESALEMMRPLAAEKGLHLEAECSAGLPTVWVDAERMLQVFSNLIGNAIKFTPDGGQITVRAEPREGRVRVGISDTGPGIAPDQLGEIFGKMWQANRADMRGIGLGLTIAKSIVEAHGETIGVNSTLGEGTEFWFTVSAVVGGVRAEAPGSPAATHATATEHSSVGGA